MDWLSRYEILGVEKEIKTDIGGYNLTGFIDLLLRDKETGEMTIVDHKSAKYPLSSKTGKVLKAHKDSFESYKRQMYLYCYAVKEEYGDFPKWIVWNHFKERATVKIPFEMKEYINVLHWFVEMLNNIENEEEFPETYDFFYCNNLCEFRSSCEYANYRNEGE